MPNVHELTIDPGHFDRVATGAKTVEIRKDDRGYTVGDTLLLQEWVPFDPMNERGDTIGYTGRECPVKVTDIVRLEGGFVALSVCTQAHTDRLAALEREAYAAGGMRKVLEVYAERKNWSDENPAEMRFEEPWQAAGFALSSQAGEFVARRIDAFVRLYRACQRREEIAQERARQTHQEEDGDPEGQRYAVALREEEVSIEGEITEVLEVLARLEAGGDE